MEVSIIYAYPNNNSYNLSILETEKKEFITPYKALESLICTKRSLILFYNSMPHIGEET
ncbi:conserved protein of unknown function [Streptococcus thermophilus]|nr:conserved protein of unknown function [Streptococcus thermophilus]CDA38443.1 unknown [Streptococcus thermophilus CAG:236]